MPSRWSASVDAAVLDDHVTGLRERRNAFAHRLIDDVDVQWRDRIPQWDFDDDAVDEALARVGEIAWMLEEGCEQQLVRAGK
ncbi:hypothetical protein ACWCQS_05490 [Streptomyces sp. NPDC002076]